MKRKYDALASKYDRWDAEHRSVTNYRRALIRPLRGKILEVAVGTGLDLPFYRQKADVTACDISGKMLKRAVARIDKVTEHRIKLVKMDAHKLLFMDGTFDVVVGTFLFCSVNDPGKVAREIKRVLKPGGQFVTLGYHTSHVLQILRRAGLRIISTKESSGGERPIGGVIATRDLVKSYVRRQSFIHH